MGKSKKASHKTKGETSERHKNRPSTKDAIPREDVLAGQDTNTAVEAVVTTRKAKRETASRVQREERNGVKRPGPGKCLEVWQYLDQHGDMMARDMKPVAVEQKWNQSNALIELYRWRKFNDIARAVTK